MARKVKTKRYAVRDAQALLAAVVDFAEAPVDRLTSATSRRTLDRVLRQGPVLVLGDQRHAVAGTAPGEVAPWKPSQFAACQRRLRHFFRAVVTLRTSSTGGLIPELPTAQLRFGVYADGRSMAVTVDGDAESVVCFEVVQLLQMVGAHSLRACPAPDCEHIFAGPRHRRFCSDRCQKRIYMREQRAKERAEAERFKRGRHGKTKR